MIIILMIEIKFKKHIYRQVNHDFPKTKFGKTCRFNPIWFTKYGDWLEYIISENAPYIAYIACYIFIPTPEINKEETLKKKNILNP